MPDIFVPMDTTPSPQYYRDCRRKGILNQFPQYWADMHRGEPRIADFDTYLAHYDSLDVDSAFERFAANKEVQWDTVADSSALAAGQCLSQRDPFLHLQIKALLADCLFGRGHYYRIMKVRDPVYNAALVQLRQRKSVK